MSAITPAALLCVGFFLTITLAEVSQDARNCWVGSSTSSAGDFPPVSMDCHQSGLVCSRLRVETLDFYSMQCVSSTSCQRNKQDLETNPSSSLYTEVICCDTNECNSYPDQPDSSESAPSSTVNLAKHCGVWLPFGSLLLLNYMNA